MSNRIVWLAALRGLWLALQDRPRYHRAAGLERLEQLLREHYIAHFEGVVHSINRNLVIPASSFREAAAHTASGEAKGSRSPTG